jgi:hypothetical protein
MALRRSRHRDLPLGELANLVARQPAAIGASRQTMLAA